MPSPKKDNTENQKDQNYFAWLMLAVSLTLIIVGIINAKAGFIAIGWSIKSQHETYNSGWYFIFLGILLGVGAVLRLRNKT